MYMGSHLKAKFNKLAVTVKVSTEIDLRTDDVLSLVIHHPVFVIFIIWNYPEEL